MMHIVEDCPVTRFPSGLLALHLADENALIWLDTQSKRWRKKAYSLFFRLSNLTLAAFEGCIVRTSIALPFIGRFWRGFQPFSSEAIALSDAYIVLISVVSWCQHFREIAVKNCEKSKNRRKCLCVPLRIDSWWIWKNFTAVVYCRECRCATV